MKIEFLQDWKHQGTDFEKGDIKSFDKATGKFFCTAGIGKDLSGSVKTEKIDPLKPVLLDVQSSNQNEVITNG